MLKLIFSIFNLDPLKIALAVCTISDSKPFEVTHIPAFCFCSDTKMRLV